MTKSIYQELNELPEGVELPAGRNKPWGTGHAVLACKEVLHEPFAVINADDYYGKEAFVKLHDFLVGYTPEKANQFCMAGFILKNTLSENGAVTRGICETNEEGYKTSILSTANTLKLSKASVTSYLPYRKGVYFSSTAEKGKISVGAERQRRYRAMKRWRADPTEEHLWEVVLLYAGVRFKTYSGLPFTYEIRKGRNVQYTKELWIDRRENSKSLAWSSVLLALGHIKKVGEVVERPKALGDIRGVTYIYGMFYRFGLIGVPDEAKEKMKKAFSKSS